MADTKISALDTEATPDFADVMPIAVDIATTPVTKKITLGNFKDMGLLNSKVYAVSRDMTASSGDVGYTSVGFKPSAIIAFAFISGAAESYSIGFCDSNLSPLGMINDSAGTMYILPSTFIKVETGGGVFQSCIVKTYDTDGFTLTWTKNGSPTGTLSIYMLCLK